MELQRAGVRRDREARAHSPRGQAGGDRVGHAVALQSRGELHCRSRVYRGWRNDGAVDRGLMLTHVGPDAAPQRFAALNDTCSSNASGRMP
jgi:hypothetical protein